MRHQQIHGSLDRNINKRKQDKFENVKQTIQYNTMQHQLKQLQIY